MPLCRNRIMLDDVMKIFSGSKGIMRIIEVVIASIILLAAMTYFLSPRITPSDWSTAYLQTEAQDALTSLDKAGLLDNYTAEKNNGGGYRLYRNLSVMLPKQVDFAINVTFSDGSSYDMCCDFDEPCCRGTEQVRAYTRVSYLSKDYQISLLLWHVFY